MLLLQLERNLFIRRVGVRIRPVSFRFSSSHLRCEFSTQVKHKPSRFPLDKSRSPSSKVFAAFSNQKYTDGNLNRSCSTFPVQRLCFSTSTKQENDDAIASEDQPVVQALSQPSWNAVLRAFGGNCIITCLKFGVAFQTGSSAMLSEAVHTLADCGNQAFLLKGLSEASNAPDKRHQYGYGKAAFFWALVSALGMFWTGAGVSLYHGIYQLYNPPVEVFEPSLSLWTVLGVSFLVDGWVLRKTLMEVHASKPKNVTMRKHLRKITDPFVLAVIMEDFAACTGVLIASSGIIATHITGDIFWDSLASIGVGVTLAVVAHRLVRMNQAFLLGQSVDKETLRGIKAILSKRNAIESVYDVQSQWVGPSTFAYKAEVDFDGSYLAASLQSKYAPRFEKRTEPLDVLLSWYAEDVTRLVEREVRAAESEIRKHYPAAAYIELEPDSRNSMEEALPNVQDSMKKANAERMALNRFMQMESITDKKE